ncbi:alkyl hydroperoxide reductase AhpD [Saccharopolyspora subtropica]|uniref:Alkyl hydroperoxide reductase AhpD n=1 Tax=Saccharopolyspora thermophila TaxID=89367 RepID=A0A917K749_9PSEU|nr:carboxymuconolactone decarboxylase family protein [Saccharopolyspora subtropica]GGJ00123.1 alkyl hydroperoxide reductase AhpD [Saccharopolyspora subtropica]
MARLNMSEAAPEPYLAFRQADGAIRKGPLAEKVRELVKLRVSQVNGCVYCVDKHAAEARRSGETEDRLTHLPVWRESELFDERERAALAYAEAVTTQRHVDDELWDEARKQFPDKAELGHLVAQVALINALNMLGVPLRMKPPRH